MGGKAQQAHRTTGAREYGYISEENDRSPGCKSKEKAQIRNPAEADWGKQESRVPDGSDGQALQDISKRESLVDMHRQHARGSRCHEGRAVEREKAGRKKE